MTKNLNNYAKQTRSNLVIWFVIILFVIGLGLIWVIYGAIPALLGFLCLIGSFIPIGLIFLFLFGLDALV